MWFCSSPRGCALPRQGIYGNPSSCEDGINCFKEKVMKKKSKPQLRALGIIAAGLAVLMVLGACGGLLDDDTYKAGSPQAGGGEPLAEGGENLVEVRVQLPSTGARSVSADMAKLYYVDYQEVIFKDRLPGADEETYYIGTAVMGQEYLTISVLANKTYDVLYLGGWLQNRTLLVTAFTNDANGYNPNGSGITIEAGKANVIKLYVNPLDLALAGEQAQGNPADVFFSWGSAPKEISRLHGKDIATLKLEISEVAIFQDLKIKIETEKFKDLIHAEGTNFSFFQNEMVLTPLTDIFEPLMLTNPSPSVASDSVTYEYVFGAHTLPEKLKSHIDAGLRYNFQYYAFGDPDSKSTLWNIRNGINHRVLDTNGEGGLIRLRIGNGSIGESNIKIEFH
jgi:hypothetical protein